MSDYSTFPLSYFKLTGNISPAAGDWSRTCEFACDTFLPDFEHPARMHRVTLLKGQAVQHNLPAPSQKIIDIVGWFRSKEDKDIMYQLYHCNIPSLGAPFPTEYLLLKKEFLLLTTPTGTQYTVSFAATPSDSIPTRIQMGKLFYPISMKFYYADISELSFL